MSIPRLTILVAMTAWLAACTAPIDFLGQLAGKTASDPWNQALRAAYGLPVSANAGALSEPVALARDNAGNLYFSEVGTDSIKKVTPEGVVSTLIQGRVDSTSSTFYTFRPGTVRTMVSDGFTRLFAVTVGDYNIAWDDKIFVIDFANSGSPTVQVVPRYVPCRYLAVDQTSRVLYGSDENNSLTIHRFHLDTLEDLGDLTQSMSGATLLDWFHSPLAVTSAGDLLSVTFSSQYDYTVNQVNTTTGALTRLAGGQGFDTTLENTAPLSTTFHYIIAMTVDTTTAPNKVTVVEWGEKPWDTQRLRQFTVTPGNVSTIVGRNSDFANFLTRWGWDADGDDRLASGALVNGPHSVVAANNAVWFTDRHNQRVRKVDGATGRVKTVAGNGATAGFSPSGTAANNASFLAPNSLTFVGDTLFFTDQADNVVRRIDATGNVVTVAGGAGPTTWNVSSAVVGQDMSQVALVESVSALAPSKAGLYILRGRDLLEIDLDGKLLSWGTDYKANSAGQDGQYYDQNFRMMAVDPENDRVYLATRNLVYRFTSQGAQLSNPKVFAGLQNLSGHDSPDDEARNFAGGGVPTSSPLSLVMGLAVGPNGLLFLSDAGSVRAVSVDGTKISQVAKRTERWQLPTGKSAVSGSWGRLAWDATNKALYYINPDGVGVLTLKNDGTADLNTWVTGPSNPFIAKDLLNSDEDGLIWIPDAKELQVAVSPEGKVFVANPWFPTSTFHQILTLTE